MREGGTTSHRGGGRKTGKWRKACGIFLPRRPRPSRRARFSLSRRRFWRPSCRDPSERERRKDRKRPVSTSVPTGKTTTQARKPFPPVAVLPYLLDAPPSARFAPAALLWHTKFAIILLPPAVLFVFASSSRVGRSPGAHAVSGCCCTSMNASATSISFGLD